MMLNLYLDFEKKLVQRQNLSGISLTVICDKFKNTLQINDITMTASYWTIIYIF